MPKTQSPIIIIGGGIIGCALLYELSRRGFNVALLEAGRIASGTTGQSGGYVRTFQTDLSLTQYSLAHYNKLKTFIPTGMNYILPNDMAYHEVNAGRINTIATCHYWIKNNDYYENTQVLEIINNGTNINALKTNHGMISASFVIMACHAPHLLYTPSISTQWFQYLSFFGYKKPLLNLKKDYFRFPLSNNTIIAGFLSRDKSAKEINHEEAHELSDLLEIDNNYEIHLASDSFSSNPQAVKRVDGYDNLLLTTAYNAGAIKIAPAVARKTATILLQSF